ncbi:MAG: CCA tRNA nucleotidyltransferase [Acholeplasmatales bacterium]
MELNKARFIIERLKQNNFEAYYVGGCVRDHLLKMESNDIDITTNAKPKDVLNLFKAVPSGIKYGTVTVIENDVNIEVTTYRKEANYEDYRRPEEVDLEAKKEEDVKRRDFTINGLLMDEHYNIYDYVGGIKDLDDKIIRAIGIPKERFNEDALRLLRAIYFQAKLGFEIETHTLKAIKEHSHLIRHLPNERVLNELFKLLKGDYQLMAFKSLEETNLDKELEGLEKGIKYINNNVTENLYIDTFFTLCFSLYGKVPNVWKFSNVHKNKYKKAVDLVLKKKEIDVLTLYENGLEISILANRVMFYLNIRPLEISKIKKMYHNLEIKSVTDLKVKGSDILKLTDKKQGSWLRELLDELVRKVILKELKNDKEELLSYCKEKLNEK